MNHLNLKKLAYCEVIKSANSSLYKNIQACLSKGNNDTYHVLAYNEDQLFNSAEP